MVVAYILPLTLMSLPAPAIVSIRFKQQIIALWQIWPLLFTITIINYHYLTIFRAQQSSKKRSASAKLRYIYGFASLCSSLCHMIALSASITSIVQSSILQTADSADLHPRRVFLPTINWKTESLQSVEEGLLQFLQWDYGIAAVATVIWSLNVYIRGFQEIGVKIDPFQLAWKTIVYSIVDGPCSAAIRLVWEWEEAFVSHNAPAIAGKMQ
jgi:hypothetical protein